MRNSARMGVSLLVLLGVAGVNGCCAPRSRITATDVDVPVSYTSYVIDAQGRSVHVGPAHVKQTVRFSKIVGGSGGGWDVSRELTDAIVGAGGNAVINLKAKTRGTYLGLIPLLPQHMKITLECEVASLPDPEIMAVNDLAAYVPQPVVQPGCSGRAALFATFPSAVVVKCLYEYAYVRSGKLGPILALLGGGTPLREASTRVRVSRDWRDQVPIFDITPTPEPERLARKSDPAARTSGVGNGAGGFGSGVGGLLTLWVLRVVFSKGEAEA